MNLDESLTGKNGRRLSTRNREFRANATAETFSLRFLPEVPSRWPAQSSPRGRKAAGEAGRRYRPRREGDARGVSVGVAAEDPGSW